MNRHGGWNIHAVPAFAQEPVPRCGGLGQAEVSVSTGAAQGSGACCGITLKSAPPRLGTGIVHCI